MTEHIIIFDKNVLDFIDEMRKWNQADFQ